MAQCGIALRLCPRGLRSGGIRLLLDALVLADALGQPARQVGDRVVVGLGGGYRRVERFLRGFEVGVRDLERGVGVVELDGLEAERDGEEQGDRAGDAGEGVGHGWASLVVGSGHSTRAHAAYRPACR